MRRLLRTLAALALASGLALAAAGSWCVAVWYPSSEHPGGAGSVLDNLDVIDVVHPFWYTPDTSGRILSQAGSRAAAQVRAWREGGALVIPAYSARCTATWRNRW